jgi:myosin heavy subunit
LQFLSEAAGSEESGGIQQTILQISPILESFGNAKTVRNDNSSRFGKWMAVQFAWSNTAPKGVAIVKANIINYLLEKSRVVTLASEERNYHIFYQVIQNSLDLKVTF